MGAGGEVYCLIIKKAKFHFIISPKQYQPIEIIADKMNILCLVELQN